MCVVFDKTPNEASHLTPQCTVLLENLTVPHLLEKHLDFYENRNFIAVLVTATNSYPQPHKTSTYTHVPLRQGEFFTQPPIHS